jgi:digalactosyldiacylglycerol synthase
VETLHRKQNHSISEDTSLLVNGNSSDELDLRIASVLESTGYRSDDGFWTVQKVLNKM